MLQIAICDDEKRIRDLLEKLVKDCVTAKITQFINGEELIKTKENFDIILLDICMDKNNPTGTYNGMDAAKHIRKKSDAIFIFITALREYVFEAYDVDAFHYLLKPINVKKFREVLLKAKEQIDKRKGIEALVIKVNGNYKRISVKDILYAENDARKIILHTKSKEITFYEKMEELERKLGDDFFRSHRGFLVSLEAVDHYDSTSIILKNGENIFLSKQKYNKFTSAYMNYLMRN